MSTSHQLPFSQRELPAAWPWLGTQEFLGSIGDRSLKTESTYLSALRSFADWLQHGRRGGYDLAQSWPLDPAGLTSELVLKFNEVLRAEKKQNTTATYMAALLSFCSYLVSIDRCPPTLNLEKVRERLKRQRRTAPHASSNVADMDIARQQIPRVVAYYEQLPLPSPEPDPYQHRLSLLRDRAIVNVLYSTAARVSEVVALNRTQVAYGRASKVLITGKGNKTRTIHLQPYAQEAIRRYVAERTDSNPALFVSHSRQANGRRLSTRSVQRIVSRAVAALGLDPRLSPHDFRHYRATALLREDVPIAIVQEYLGHADISTTRAIYAPVVGDNIVAEWLANVSKSPLEAVAEWQASESAAD